MQRLLNSGIICLSMYVCPNYPCWVHCAVRYILCCQVYFLLSGIFCAVRYIPNLILKSSPENANISDGRTVFQKQIGITLRSWEEIEEFNAKYVEENPLFWPMSSNCQKYKVSLFLSLSVNLSPSSRYVLSLATFLVGEENALGSLPPLEVKNLLK